MPEWYFVVATLIALSALGALWHPLLWTTPLLLAAIGASLAQALLAAWRSSYRYAPRTALGRLRLHAMTAWLHLLQPLARLVGRIRHGLTPWRPRDGELSLVPRTYRMATLIAGPWQAPEDKLLALERELRQRGAVVKRGGAFDRWDLEVQGGLLAGARVLLSVEDLAPGKQLVRFRSWPAFGRLSLGLLGVVALLAATAFVDRATGVGGVLAASAIACTFRMFEEAAYSQSALMHALRRCGQDE
jgi:hypothetical protein